MKPIIFNENEIESFKKNGIVKYIILSLAPIIGVILSCVLAYINIDFIELLKILNENIFNPEIVDKLISLICKWYTISIFSIFGALLWLLPIIFFNRNKKIMLIF